MLYFLKNFKFMKNSHTKTSFYQFQSIPLYTKRLLWKAYLENQTPNMKELQIISRLTNLPLWKTLMWFKYQRFEQLKYVFKKKQRFSKKQRILLEKVFQYCQTLDLKMLNYLKNMLKCSEVDIKHWFFHKNRRFDQMMKRSEKKKNFTYNSFLMGLVFVKNMLNY